MESFSREDIIKWDHEYSINDEWVEYRECMINSPSWEGIIPQYQDLHDALKPNSIATISLKGGLRVPKQNGWLQGYQPKLTIYAFDDSVRLRLQDRSTANETIIDQLVETNKPISSFPSLDPGVYLLEVDISGKIADRRSLQILPWDLLGSPQPNQTFYVNLVNFSLQGAVIRLNEVSDNEEV